MSILKLDPDQVGEQRKDTAFDCGALPAQLLKAPEVTLRQHRPDRSHGLHACEGPAVNRDSLVA
ncbi:hypothetical protein [Ponticoccus litoralis]|uniref:Uncharacterized protein n=1 Tax=Ponticoccus litoralis TaxID=422297 RepID=A0AAW9SPM8_9RHOB